MCVTYDHGCVTFVIVTTFSLCPLFWLINGFVSRVTRLVPLVDQELPDNHPGSFLVVHFVLLYALVPCCDIPSICMQNNVQLAFTPFVCMSVWEWNVPFLSSIVIFLRGWSCFILIIPCSFSSNFFFLLFFFFPFSFDCWVVCPSSIYWF